MAKLQQSGECLAVVEALGLSIRSKYQYCVSGVSGDKFKLSQAYLKEMGIEVWISRPIPSAQPLADDVDERASAIKPAQDDSLTGSDAPQPVPVEAAKSPAATTSDVHRSDVDGSDLPESDLHIVQYGDWVMAAATPDPILDQIALAIHGRSIRGVKLSGPARYLIVLGTSLQPQIGFAADDTIVSADVQTLRQSARDKRELWRQIQQRIHGAG